MLIIVLKRVKAKCVETRKHKDKYLEAKKKRRGLFTSPNVKQKGKNLKCFAT